MKIPFTLLSVVFALLAGCAKPETKPLHPIQVQVTSSPAQGNLFLDGRPMGATPQTLTVGSVDDLIHLTAKAGTEEMVEKRIRFLSLDQAEVEFTFGAGTSAMAKALGLARILVFDYGTGVTFEVDHSDLKPAFLPLLDRQAQLLDKYFNGLEIRICGHTDSLGSQDHNLALSLARAKAVAATLEAKGVAKERMKLQGFGSTYPLASNQTDHGRALNRRTELVLPQ
jgi:outer membrane protein OmpA-like peptidoglycan-associated protein